MKKENQKNEKVINKDGRKRKLIFLSIFVIVILIASFLIFISDDKKESTMETLKTEEPRFVKNGELTFEKKKNNVIINKIDIEIADNENKRMQGLMWRRSMSDLQGMLFIFEKEQPQSFWMKNTYIPLDIIYINHSFDIVTIQANTTPFSEAPVPSYKPAQYVVEVNAGFCVKNKIEEGDKIIYKTIK
jgi:uncharacterized protein